jgi:hypothetical protein
LGVTSMSDTRQERCRAGSREATAIKTWSFTFYRVCRIFKPTIMFVTPLLVYSYPLKRHDRG